MAVVRISALAAIVFGNTLACVCSVSAQSIDESRSVLTQHNDPQRTGWYRSETVLTPANVAPNRFGELYHFNVNGMVTAQPLYVRGVQWNGARRNILYVATGDNDVYAFEIKQQSAVGPDQTYPELKKVNLGASALLPGMIDGPTPCGQTRWRSGITSTPVIDPKTNTMYVVYRVAPSNAGSPVGAQFRLAALDIQTLNLRTPPITITAPSFNADVQLNRPGLLLAGGLLYAAFGGAVCDYGGDPNQPIDKRSGHGWVFAFDTSDLGRPPAVFNTTPNSTLGGIWQSGNGLSAFRDSVYAFTGNNGVPGSPAAASDYGESILKLKVVRNASGDLAFDSPASPAHVQVGNWYRLDAAGSDTDLAAGGPVILPNERIIGGGKQGRLYVIDPVTMTQTQTAFQAFYNTWHPETDVCNYDAQQQYGPNIHGSPVYWHPHGVDYGLFYGMPEKEYLKGFRAYDDGRIDTWPSLSTIDLGERSPDGMPGGFLSISSNGGDSGIVWATVPAHVSSGKTAAKDVYTADATYVDVPGRLIAFDAVTLRELWSDSGCNGCNFSKFVPPTIADGKVFRAGYFGHIGMDGAVNARVTVYGLGGTGTAALPPSLRTLERRVTVSSPPAADASVTLPYQDPLWIFTAAASGQPLATFFRAYNAVDSSRICTDGWRGWFPIAGSYGDYRLTRSGDTPYPITAVWRPAMPAGSQHLDLFAVGSDGSVQSTYYERSEETRYWQSGNWQDRGWFKLRPESGKSIPGQPVTAVWRNDGKQLDLFMTDATGHVRTLRFANGEWQRAWSQVAPDTGRAALRQEITALWRPGSAHLDLFMTGDDGYVKSIYAENDVWQRAWFSLHPQSARSVAPQTVTALWRPGAAHLDLFLTANDGSVKSIYFDHDAWQSEWFRIRPESGKAAAHQPITAVWRPNMNHLDLFMVQNDRAVRSIYFDNDAWQPQWFSLRPDTGRAAIGEPVSAIWRTPNHLDLFIGGADGRVKSIYFEHDAWQPNWFSL